MNRGLVMTLCAAALAAGSLAQAQVPNVNISLNLRYKNPSAPAQGGTWYLVAKTDSAVGIAAVNAYISNIATAGIAYGTPATGFGTSAATFGNYTAVTGANIAAELNNSNQPFVVAGTPVNVVYFQDTANGPVVGNVGGATFAQRQATDPLRNTAAWNNSTVVASGTFAGGGTAANLFNRPAFAPKGGNSTDANTLATAIVPSNNAIDANVTVTVRGDSVYFGPSPSSGVSGPVVATPLESPAGSGLRFGDLNRNGAISFVGDVLPAYNRIGLTPGLNIWDNGDFNGNGNVSFVGDVLPAYNAIGLAAPTPPAIGAVPEPATAALLVAGLLALGVGRRQK